MSDISSENSPDNSGNTDIQLSLSNTNQVIQVLYKAATGRTDKLSHRFSDNYIITAEDIDHLHARLGQCFATYHILAGPTVTIVVEYENGEKDQYSGYDKYRAAGTHRPQIVSEISLKYELIIRLPDAEKPQRYIINISAESRMFIIDENSDTNFFSSPNSWFYMASSPSIYVSVDYVDYMYAKVFVGLTEEWVKTIQTNKNNRTIEWCGKRMLWWPVVFRRFSFIGSGLFIITYTLWHRERTLDTSDIAIAISFALIVFALSNYIFEWFGEKFLAVIRDSITPTVILLTRGDATTYESHLNRKKTTRPKLVTSVIGTLLTTGLHAAAGGAIAAIKALF
jgi:hypothetical protein